MDFLHMKNYHLYCWTGSKNNFPFPIDSRSYFFCTKVPLGPAERAWLGHSVSLSCKDNEPHFRMELGAQSCQSFYDFTRAIKAQMWVRGTLRGPEDEFVLSCWTTKLFICQLLNATFATKSLGNKKTQSSWLFRKNTNCCVVLLLCASRHRDEVWSRVCLLRGSW